MKNKIYICPICGNIVQKVKDSGIDIVCCGKPMLELIPNSIDASLEKHVPIYTKEGNKISVKVAEKEHPMEEKHFIEWILIETKKGSQIKHLKYTDKPEAEFILSDDDEFISVYAYCNLHGLWMNK